MIVQTYKVHLGRQAFADVCSSCLAHPALFVFKTSNDDLQFDCLTMVFKVITLGIALATSSVVMMMSLIV